MSDRKKQLRTVLFQFATIFFSVVLALLADDWRASQIEHAEEREVLLQLREELSTDAADLRVYRSKLAQQDSAAHRFVLQVYEGAPIDTLLKSVEIARSSWGYRPKHPTYRGLTQSGQLDLIGDTKLRQEIIAYHDDHIEYVNLLRANHKTEMEKLNTLLRKYFSFFPDSSYTWKFRFYGSVTTMLQDTQLLAEVGQSGQRRRRLISVIGNATIPRNEELGDSISAYLE